MNQLNKEMINKFMQTQTCLFCGSQRCEQTKEWLEGCQKFKIFIEKETTNMIQNYSKCELCIHQDICRFQANQEEILTKMNGHLDNIYKPDIFKFSFECSRYRNKNDLGVNIK